RDRYSEEVTIAVIESTAMSHEHSGLLEVRATRPMPANLQVAVNLNLQLPPGLDLAQLGPGFQSIMQQLQQAIAAQANQAVVESLKQQAPAVNMEVGLRGASWKRIET